MKERVVERERTEKGTPRDSQRGGDGESVMVQTQSGNVVL